MKCICDQRRNLSSGASKENDVSLQAEKTLDDLSACQLESDYVHKVSGLIKLGALKPVICFEIPFIRLIVNVQYR